MDGLYDTLNRLSTSEKWGLLQLLLLFNAVIGFGFFFGTLWIDPMWGSGASFQAVFTSIIHEGYNAYLLVLVRERQVRNVDFLGGIMVMMNVLLLETAALWGDFAGGLNLHSAVPGVRCVPSGGSSERFVTVLATILFLVHLGISALVFMWKNTLFQDSIPYKHIGGETGRVGYQDAGYHQQSHGNGSSTIANDSAVNGNSNGNAGVSGNRFVIDDDDDDGDAHL